MNATDLIVATLVVVVLLNLLDLAQTSDVAGWSGKFNGVIRHVLDPATPLIGYAPADPNHVRKP